MVGDLYKRKKISGKIYSFSMVRHLWFCLLLSMIFSLAGWSADGGQVSENRSNLKAEEAKLERLRSFLYQLRAEYLEALNLRKRAFLGTVYDDNLPQDEIPKPKITFDKSTKKINGLEKEIGETEDKLRESESRVAKLKKGTRRTARSVRLTMGEDNVSTSVLKEQDRPEHPVTKKGKGERRELEELLKIEKAEQRRSKLEAKKKEKKQLKEQKRLKKIQEKERKRERKLAEARRKKMLAAKEEAPEKVKIVKKGSDPTRLRESAMKSLKFQDDVVVIHDFNTSTLNNFGQKTNIYNRMPSYANINLAVDSRKGENLSVMHLTYDKKSEGGPFNHGGWCGLYTILKDEASDVYMDVSEYKYISMWVRGETGDENFVVSLADKRWEKLGDSLKSKNVTAYSDKPSLGTEWQKIQIPLDVYNLQLKELASLAIGFESSCFSGGAGKGGVYVDDIAFEK